MGWIRPLNRWNTPTYINLQTSYDHFHGHPRRDPIPQKTENDFMEPKYGGDEGHPLIILWQCAWMLRGLTLHSVGMASLMMAQLAIPPPPRNFLPIPKVFFGCSGDIWGEMHTQFNGRNPAPVDMVTTPLLGGFHTCQLVSRHFFHQHCFRIHAPRIRLYVLSESGMTPIQPTLWHVNGIWRPSIEQN